MIRLTFPDHSFYEFPGTFYWSDEAQWDPVAQATKYLLPVDGEASFLIQETVKAAGRPITLVGMMPWNDMQALRAAAVASPDMTLEMTGRPNRTVVFARPAVDGQRAGGGRETPADTDWATVTIRLLEI